MKTITSKHYNSSLWLLPNIIGYIRIILLLSVVFIAFSRPLLTFIIYLVAANLDAVDGFLARKLNQQSKLGAILDYATDRGSDVLMFLMLAVLYKEAWSFFCFLLMLDIFSHICQLYSTVFLKQESHKNIGKQQGRLLNLYYSSRPVLYYACASYGLWLACWYLHYFYPLAWMYYLSFVFLPGFVFKVVVHFIQVVSVFRMVSMMGPGY